MGRKGVRRRERPTDQNRAIKKARFTVVDPFSYRADQGLGILQQASGPNPRFEGPYGNYYDILLIGEGDFSFALSLATSIGGNRLVATSYDSKAMVLDKYPAAMDNIVALVQMGTTVMHGVDGSKLMEKSVLSAKKFHQIVFNFPHAGGSKEEDVEINRALLAGFFESVWGLILVGNGQGQAPHILHPIGSGQKAEIHVALRNTPFYESWNIQQLAESCNLKLVSCKPFESERFVELGYTPQRTTPAVREAPSVQDASLYIFSPVGMASTTPSHSLQPITVSEQQRVRKVKLPKVPIKPAVDYAKLKKAKQQLSSSASPNVNPSTVTVQKDGKHTSVVKKISSKSLIHHILTGNSISTSGELRTSEPNPNKRERMALKRAVKEKEETERKAILENTLKSKNPVVLAKEAREATNKTLVIPAKVLSVKALKALKASKNKVEK